MRHDQSAQRVHQHPRRKEQAGEHVDTPDEQRDSAPGRFRPWNRRRFTSNGAIHQGC